MYHVGTRADSNSKCLCYFQYGFCLLSNFSCIVIHAHDPHSCVAPVLLWLRLWSLFVSRSQFAMACPSFVAAPPEPYHKNKFCLMSEDDKLQTLRDSILSLGNCVASMGLQVNMGRRHDWFNPSIIQNFDWDNATNSDKITVVKEGVLALQKDISMIAHHTSTSVTVTIPDLSVLEFPEPDEPDSSDSNEPPRKRPARTL